MGPIMSRDYFCTKLSKETANGLCVASCLTYFDIVATRKRFEFVAVFA